MFLLCGARPYVCIGWLWAWRWAICFYYVALGHMFLLVGCGPYVLIGDCYESYHMFSLTMEPSAVHVIHFAHKNSARSLLSIQSCIPLEVKYSSLLWNHGRSSESE